MRLLRPVVLIGCLGLLGCQASKLNYDDAVALSGRALDANGAALSGVQVILYSTWDSGCSLDESEVRTLKTGTDGRFGIQLIGGDTMTGFGTAKCFRLAVGPVREGAGVSAQFTIQKTFVEVPDLQVWNPSLTFQAQTGALEISFVLPSASVSAQVGAAVWLGDENLLEYATVTNPFRVDDWWLQDFADTRASLTSRETEAREGGFTMSYASDRVLLPRMSAVPPSRGASCSYLNVEPSPCPLTDGRAAATTLSADYPLFRLDEGTSELRFEMAQARVIRRALAVGIVLDNPEATIALEGSTEGTAWATFGEAAPDGSHWVLELGAQTPSVSHLRLVARSKSGGAGPKFKSLKEVAFFE